MAALARTDSLQVYPPRHAQESTNVRRPHTFTITAEGFARRADDLYVFEGSEGGCYGLSAELAYSHDSQQRYYRFAVRGHFLKRTFWDAFQDAGKRWACVYLIAQGGSELRHIYIPFVVAAPPIGHLRVYAPKHAAVGHRYVITARGFATRTDSLWIYPQRRSAGRCLGWYAFYGSTYSKHHPAYREFVVHRSFAKSAVWEASRTGAYDGCVYMAETKAYPSRFLVISTRYRVR